MIKFGLRAFFIMGFVLIAIFIAVICGGLWLVSDHLEKTAFEMNDTVDGIAAAQSVLEGLDAHRRQSLLKNIETKDERENRRSHIAESLQHGLLSLEGFNVIEHEHDLAEVVRSNVETYLTESARLTKEGSTGMDLFMKTAPAYDAALNSIFDLNRFNQNSALEVESNSVSSSGVYKKWTLFILGLMVVGVGLIIGLFHNYIYFPLMEMKRYIARYARFQKVPEEIPSAVSEIHDISRAFQKLAQTLNRQDEQRLIFLAAVAHDLKNPLAAILMSCEILAEQDDANELVEIVGRQASQLRRLVDDLLNATRIEAGDLELNKAATDLRDILRDSVKLFKTLSPIHAVQLVLPEHETILDCDGQRLGQVFNNLLSNAIKYSPQGGEVQVALSINDKTAVVSVIDQGIGIQSDEIETIFEPFRRPSASRHQIPGVGLGLSTSRKIVEAHGGNIRVQACDKRPGTQFSVILPLMA